MNGFKEVEFMIRTNMLQRLEKLSEILSCFSRMRMGLSMLMFILDFDLDSDLTMGERISELASKGIISNIQYKNLIEIFNFVQTINSKTSKITYQELDKIDELIDKLREINVFFNSIFDKKKIERRKEKENRIKRHDRDHF